MARITPTRDYVRIIAQELAAAGTPVTQARIRALILERHGIKASPNVVADELDSILKARAASAVIPPSVASPLRDTPETKGPSSLSPDVRELAQALMNAVWREAESELLVKHPEDKARETLRVQRLQRDLEDTQRALAEQLQKQEEQLASSSGLQMALEDATERIRVLQNENDVVRVEVAGLREARETLISTYEARLAEQQKLLAARVEELQADKQRDAEMWEGLKKYLMRETDRIREEQAMKVSSLQERLDNANLFLEQWRRQVNRLTEDLSAANRRAESAEEELAKLKHPAPQEQAPQFVEEDPED